MLPFLLKFKNRLLVSSALLILTAAAHAGVGITGITITTPGPVNIPCGGSATITVVVSYRITVGGAGGTRTVSLIEDDTLPFSDDTLAQGTITVLATDPQKGTKTIQLTLSCSQPDGNCQCTLSGNVGADDEHGTHHVYARCSSSESANLVVNCVKPGGVIAMGQPPAVIGGGMQLPVSYVQHQPIAGFQLDIGYDPTFLSAQNVFIDPAVVSAFPNAQFDVSTPGLVSISGSTGSDVVVDPFAFAIDFVVAPNAPPFLEQPIDLLMSSFFVDALGNPIDVGHAQVPIPFLPFDNLPPLIDPLLLILDIPNDQILGLPGAVQENFLNPPQPLLIAPAIVFPGEEERVFFDAVPVQPDGSFVMTGVGLDPSLLTVQLFTEDIAGQTGSTFTSPEIDFLGVPQVGQPVQFIVYDPASQENWTAICLLSCTGNSPGFPLPGDGRIVPLVYDPCTDLGLAFGSLLTGITDPLGIATTPQIPLPPAPPGLTLHTAAVTLDPQQGQWQTITNPGLVTIQ
ncbi:MAG: hypothetical protein RL885_08305 [Planctomycetota bacterium]